MKIALNYIYLSEKHAGGKDQVGLNLLKGFYEHGHTKHMMVICYEYSREVIKAYAPDIKIVSIKNPGMNNELGRLLSISYVNTFVIPKLIKKYHIALIYHLSCTNGFRKMPCISVMIPHDIKAVAHRVLANVKIPYYKYMIYKIMYQMDFKHADKIIAISNTDKKEISEFYPEFSHKIKRIYNPIDFKPLTREQSMVGDDIVAVNLQFHHKNIITLIKAFELIKDQISGNLILVGKVPERVNYLKEYVETHHLESRVIFTGFVENEDLYRYLLQGRLYVNPTLYEGFGMTAVEAIICQVPTLVSKIETNYEVTQGLCDYYEPPEDEKKLAEKLLECLNKTYDSAILKENSRKLFDRYNYDTVSEKYFCYFRALLSDRHQ